MSKAIWDLILEKMEKKLAGWKKFYLSKEGQLTLIKSILFSLTTYYLSLWDGWLCKIPFGEVADSLQTCPMGGCLGFHSLVWFNQALLGKWLWRFAYEKKAFWHTITKYGVLGGGWTLGLPMGGLTYVSWGNVSGMGGIVLHNFQSG